MFHTARAVIRSQTIFIKYLRKGEGWPPSKSYRTGVKTFLLILLISMEGNGVDILIGLKGQVWKKPTKIQVDSEKGRGRGDNQPSLAWILQDSETWCMT